MSSTYNMSLTDLHGLVHIGRKEVAMGQLIDCIEIFEYIRARNDELRREGEWDWAEESITPPEFEYQANVELLPNSKRD